jgi:flagellar hook-length control protein FliK
VAVAAPAAPPACALLPDVAAAPAPSPAGTGEGAFSTLLAAVSQAETAVAGARLLGAVAPELAPGSPDPIVDDRARDDRRDGNDVVDVAALALAFLAVVPAPRPDVATSRPPGGQSDDTSATVAASATPPVRPLPLESTLPPGTGPVNAEPAVAGTAAASALASAMDSIAAPPSPVPGGTRQDVPGGAVPGGAGQDAPGGAEQDAPAEVATQERPQPAGPQPTLEPGVPAVRADAPRPDSTADVPRRVAAGERGRPGGRETVTSSDANPRTLDRRHADQGQPSIDDAAPELDALRRPAPDARMIRATRPERLTDTTPPERLADALANRLADVDVLSSRSAPETRAVGSVGSSGESASLAAIPSTSADDGGTAGAPTGDHPREREASRPRAEDGPEAIVAASASADTPPARAAAPSTGSDHAARSASSLAEQVAERVRTLDRPGRHELTVRLDPPDLGSLRIEARLDGNRLALRLVAEGERARDALEQALPRLRDSLSQHGIVATRLDVDLGNGAASHQSPREGAWAPAPTPAPPAPAREIRRVAALGEREPNIEGVDLWA